jgi:hypothetical protein
VTPFVTGALFVTGTATTATKLGACARPAASAAGGVARTISEHDRYPPLFLHYYAIWPVRMPEFRMFERLRKYGLLHAPEVAPYYPTPLSRANQPIGSSQKKSLPRALSTAQNDTTRVTYFTGATIYSNLKYALHSACASSAHNSTGDADATWAIGSVTGTYSLNCKPAQRSGQEDGALPPRAPKRIFGSGATNRPRTFLLALACGIAGVLLSPGFAVLLPLLAYRRLRKRQQARCLRVAEKGPSHSARAK